MDTDAQRSELLADVIEVDSLYRRHARTLVVALVLSALVNLAFAGAVFALVVRNHVFILPDASHRAAPAEKAFMNFRVVGNGAEQRVTLSDIHNLRSPFIGRAEQISRPGASRLAPSR